ncbi:MAG: hypothetical protein MZW92_43240 [Comamonadaceae bacterium]|nr:hypothetical protein [Comamonadaceae bacterium]
MFRLLDAQRHAAPVAGVELSGPHQPDDIRAGTLPPVQHRPAGRLPRQSPRHHRPGAGGLRDRPAWRAAVDRLPRRRGAGARRREPAADQRLPLPRRSTGRAARPFRGRCWSHPPGSEILFLSGTASIVGHHTVHAGDVAAQCTECLANRGRRGRGGRPAGARSGPFSLAELDYRVYVRHAHDFPQVRQTMRSQVPGDARIVFLQADICRPDLLLEIEAFGSHPMKEAP